MIFDSCALECSCLYVLELTFTNNISYMSIQRSEDVRCPLVGVIRAIMYRTLELTFGLLSSRVFKN